MVNYRATSHHTQGITQGYILNDLIKMEDALHIIPQVVCTLFQRNGSKLLAYGDSLRTGVKKGLLHNSNASSILSQ